jgi:exodeoxyribonuclease V gamma subunit
MPLYLNVSNSLKELAGSFCEELNNREGNVFQPTYIITQTEGMNTWLKYQIAGKLGIAANYRFIKSQDMINMVYFLLGGNSSETLSRENLLWILFKLLGEKDFTDRFTNIAAYYNTGLPDSDVKKMALAEKVADLFDQYQMYRPDMINEWNHRSIHDTQDWQSYLWNSFRRMLGDKLPDRTRVSSYIAEQLKNPAQQQALQAKLPVVYLFGLSITTNYHLQLYYTLGQFIDIRFYLVNPAPGQYWFEDKSAKQIARLQQKGFADISETPGNTLLTSWGKVLQDTYSLLFQNDDLLNNYNEIASDEPEPTSLLKKIRFDIYQNNADASDINADELKDGSIVINSCYSEAREVEVLYNYLVGLIDKRKEQLSPREILVMVSDINTYAPYIKAVFDNAPYKFPYNIADEGYIEQDTVSAALKSLLGMKEEEFTAENVIRLLDSSFIRERFGITETGPLRDAVNNANIRFGIENNMDDESTYVSWTYGMKRLMFGICMNGDAEYGSDIESLYPIDMLEGAAALQLINFNHFVEILVQSIEERSVNRTVAEWIQYVQDVVDNMICEPESASDEDYYALLKQLEAYNTLHEYFDDKVSFDVFCLSFTKQLDTVTNSSTFLSAGITFCSLIPMRSIPFKVIAMLGLGFDKFPRKDVFLSFNLMDEKKQKGDRSVKENDKHLFLETILSANDYLYISYVGQSIKDNTSVPPSILVDELLGYIQNGAGQSIDVKKLMVKKHPLHGFSRQYNQQELHTYLSYEIGHSLTLINPDKQQEALNFDEIPLHALSAFFKDPFKGYYNSVLKIYYTDEETLLEENEIFELNGLQQWSLKHDIVSIEEEAMNTMRDKMVKTGKLPLKNMADVLLENTVTEVSGIRDLWVELIEGASPSSMPVAIKLDDSTITGDIHCYGNKLITISFSRNDIKNMMGAYLQYIAARAAGITVSMHFISAGKKKDFTAIAMSQEEAINRLKALVALYKKGHDGILCFHPSFDIAPNKVDDANADIFSAAVEKELNRFGGTYADKYILNEYENGFFNAPGAFSEYKQHCELLLKPLAHLFPGYFD